MVMGSVCFSMVGLIVLCVSDAAIGQWAVIIPYYLIYGAARSVWENTNKSVISEYFKVPGAERVFY